jgi:hypothetical protein
VARTRLELLRLHLQLARLEYRIACHDRNSGRCTQFMQKLVTPLTKIDAKLQDLIQKLQSGTAPSSSDESGLDNAAAGLAAGS